MEMLNKIRMQNEEKDLDDREKDEIELAMLEKLQEEMSELSGQRFASMNNPDPKLEGKEGPEEKEMKPVEKQDSDDIEELMRRKGVKINQMG